MGTIVLIVIMAAWAAVLLPPLLRSRAENRPNSSVSDFRAQLSSLQRAMPTRGVSVRSMGRSLAPSTFSRPARQQNPRGQHSYGPARTEPPRAPDAPRARTHGARDEEPLPWRRPAAAAPVNEIKRRRSNVLFVLVLTTVCGGFLAATTDSKAMVLFFAVSMIALGGYVYLLITLNQREQGVPAFGAAFAARPRPAPQPRATAPRDPLLSDWREARDDDRRAGYSYDYDYDDGAYGGIDDETMPAPRAPRRSAQSGSYRYRPADGSDVPGSGRSGRISYGRATREGYAMPAPRDPRDPFGREQSGREITRRTPVRNGRHATGQQPVQRRRAAAESPSGGVAHRAR